MQQWRKRSPLKCCSTFYDTVFFFKLINNLNNSSVDKPIRIYQFGQVHVLWNPNALALFLNSNNNLHRALLSSYYISSALRIYVSNESHSRLVELGGFYFEERGQVQIKVRKQRFILQPDNGNNWRWEVILYYTTNSAKLAFWLV